MKLTLILFQKNLTVALDSTPSSKEHQILHKRPQATRTLSKLLSDAQHTIAPTKTPSPSMNALTMPVTLN